MQARDLEDRRLAAARRQPPVRLLDRPVAHGSLARRVLGRREAEHERLSEAACVAAGRNPAGVDTGRPEAVDRRPVARGSTRARSSTRSPPIVCVIDAITRTAATAPEGGSNGRSESATCASGGRGSTISATVRSRTFCASAGVVEDVVGLRVTAVSSRLHDVGLRPRHLVALEELDPVLVEDAREAAVELRQRRRARSRPRLRPACFARRTRPSPADKRRASVEREAEAVALRPRARAQPKRRRRGDVARHEVG